MLSTLLNEMDGVAALALSNDSNACLAYGGGPLPRAVLYKPDEPAADLAARALAASAATTNGILKSIITMIFAVRKKSSLPL